ncbi:hypothetical protein Tco_0007557 [Tanacetum coccineum]
MKLDGMNKEEEEAIIRIKGEVLEKDDPGAFVIPIRLKGKINLNALVDTGSYINVIPYRIYKELGREEVHNVKKGISMLNHLKAEPMELLSNVLCQEGVTTIIAKFLILDMPIDRDTPILITLLRVLKMVDLIYVPGVDSHQLRMKVFPLSLADDANEWWISEEITTWEELVEKFFYRFYPESYDGEDEMLDEGEN